MLVNVTTAQVSTADALERIRIRKLNIWKPSKTSRVFEEEAIFTTCSSVEKTEVFQHGVDEMFASMALVPVIKWCLLEIRQNNLFPGCWFFFVCFCRSPLFSNRCWWETETSAWASRQICLKAASMMLLMVTKCSGFPKYGCKQEGLAWDEL